MAAVLVCISRHKHWIHRLYGILQRSFMAKTLTKMGEEPGTRGG